MPDKYDPEYYRYRRKLRIKKHLCTRCGKPADGTAITCSECRRKSKERHTKKKDTS